MEWRVRNCIGGEWQPFYNDCFIVHFQRWTGALSLWMTFAGSSDPRIATHSHRHFLLFWLHLECLLVGRKQSFPKSTHGWVLLLILLARLSKWHETNMSSFWPFSKTWLRAKSFLLRPLRKHLGEFNGPQLHALWQNRSSSLFGSGSLLARMLDSRGNWSDA